MAAVATWPVSGEPFGSCGARHFSVCFGGNDGISAELAPIPEGFVCPITQDVMQNPVMTCDGQVYEREAIEDWFRWRRGPHPTSPNTGLNLPSISLLPLSALRAAIQTYLQHRPEIRRREVDRLSLSEAAQVLQSELLQKQNQFRAATDPVQSLQHAVQQFVDAGDASTPSAELVQAEAFATRLAETIDMASQLMSEHEQTCATRPSEMILSQFASGSQHVPGSSSTEMMMDEASIERQIPALLDNLASRDSYQLCSTVLERLASVHITRASELELCVDAILQWILSQPVNFIGKLVAELVVFLQARYPEFPPEEEGGDPCCFRSVLLHAVQQEFENAFCVESAEEDNDNMRPEEIAIDLEKRNHKDLAVVTFIGHLFLHGFLAVKVVGKVVHRLIGIRDTPCPEHFIECACAFMVAVGRTLDSTQRGKMLMSQFAVRLVDLKRAQRPNGGHLYSQRVRSEIDRLLEL